MSARHGTAPSPDPVGEEPRLRLPHPDGMWTEPLPAPEVGGRDPRPATATYLAVIVGLALVALLLVLIL